MNIDLLRQQQRWKDGLQELRTGLASVAQVKHAFQNVNLNWWKISNEFLINSEFYRITTNTTNWQCFYISE